MDAGMAGSHATHLRPLAPRAERVPPLEELEDPQQVRVVPPSLCPASAATTRALAGGGRSDAAVVALGSCVAAEL